MTAFGDRRAFLRSMAASGAFLLGCGGEEGIAPVDGDGGAGGEGGTGGEGGAAGECRDAADELVAGGELLGLAGFVDEADFPLDTERNQGWDGRLYTDLTVVDRDRLVIPNETFYVRTSYPDLLVPPDPWILRIRGLVAAPSDLSLDELLPLAEDMGAVLLECSGNSAAGSFGLMSAASWRGVPLSTVLERLEVLPSATRLLVSGFDEHSMPSSGGHSKPGASWIFTFDDLARAGAFLATEMNGASLPPNHGQPVRLLVPGWYGCCNIKWVDELRLVDDTEPATSQMQEFASRTHQPGVPELAKDYLPATLDQAAMPVRVEKWRVDGEIVHRVIGILWGGYEPTGALEVRFGGASASFEPVDVCPAMTTNRTWTVWHHLFRPKDTGPVAIRCRIADEAIPTRRLDAGYYERVVAIDEV